MGVLYWLAWSIAFIGAEAVMLTAGSIAVRPRNCCGYGPEYATWQYCGLFGGAFAAVVGSVAGALL